jgi:AraC family transcriptional regulator
MSSDKLALHEHYKARINLVMDYIEKNLDREFTLDELAGQACFSKFHFHRIFNAFIGETMFNFIQRLRLEKAALLLQNDPRLSITSIALNCGFNSSAAFARSFKKYFNMSASQWRLRKTIESHLKSNMGKINGNSDKDSHHSSGYISYNQTIPETTLDIETNKYNVSVEDFSKKTVAYIRYIGPYQGDQQVFERLYAKLFKWAGTRNLIDEDMTQIINIYHDDTEITDKQKLRVSACITVPDGTKVDGEVNMMHIPGGKYACASCVLAPPEYQEAWDWMYKNWLPASGYVPDDRLSFELYYLNNLFADEQKTKHNVQICIPVKPMGQ